MGRPPQNAQGAADLARAHIIEARDSEALRAAQATLMPLLGLSLDTTADVVGRSRWWVSRARGRYLRGEQVTQHGGRRQALISESEEVELLKRAVRNANPLHRTTVRDQLRRILDRKTSEPVSDSYLTDLVNRAVQRVLPGAELWEFQQVAHSFAQIWDLEQRIAERSLKNGA
jgi:transposase